jgi:outer membrane protein insertion porin family/translocation and assembly module TamA
MAHVCPPRPRRARSIVPLLTFALLVATGCKETGGIQVHSLAFTGVHAVSESSLRAVMATAVSSRLPWGHKAYFDRDRFEADLERIRAFYVDRGYPDARVTGIKVDLNEAQTRVDLTVNIDEGQPVLVDTIVFKGFEVLPQTHYRYMRRRAPLKTGGPLDRQLLQSTAALATNELKDHGYAYAQVTTAEHTDVKGTATKPAHVTVTFNAKPGVQARFGPIAIVGNKGVGTNIIARELTYQPGDLYRVSEIQKSQRRVYSLNLFQFANIAPSIDNPQVTEIPTRVTVAEGQAKRVTFSFGYGSEDKARGEIEYRNLNFLGGARTGGVRAKWSSIDRGVELTFDQPYVLAPGISVTGRARQWYESEPAYSLATSGGQVTITKSWTRSGALTPGEPLLQGTPDYKLSATLTSEYDRNTISKEALSDPSLRNDLIALNLDPDSGRRAGTLNAVSIDFSRNTTTNLLNPTRGSVVTLHLESAANVLPGTYHYTAYGTDLRKYVPLGDRWIFASRLQFGTIDGQQGDIPFFKRFFLGGSTSIRGWGRYEISPLRSGLPIGGQSMMAATTELRLPITEKIGAVAFLDFGNVWTDSWDVRLGDLRYAIGPGLRYLTPIGPVRVDFGYQLNPISGLLIDGRPQTRRWRIHFSIGQAF